MAVVVRRVAVGRGEVDGDGSDGGGVMSSDGGWGLFLHSTVHKVNQVLRYFLTFLIVYAHLEQFGSRPASTNHLC